jgi:2,4-dienoyl-CoA reductase-like NADH-dependent reductase (Old Yellow Enzyme family)
MSILFENSEINGMKLRNRFVRSATWEGMASPEGEATPALIETMTLLAKGGVGLIISSHAYVRPEGRATPWQIGIYKDDLIDGLRQMTAAVHAAGGKIVLQLAHAGHFAAETLTGTPPRVVSDYEGLAATPRKELTAKDIEELVGAFAEAAGRAKAAGFDGVQIHAAHGCLLGRFLSPAFHPA